MKYYVCFFVLLMKISCQNSEIQSKTSPGYYDKKEDNYILNRAYFNDQMNFKVFNDHLNDGIFKLNKKSFQYIVDANSKNFLILMKICNQISADLVKYLKISNYKRANQDGMDGYTLRELIFNSLNDKKYNNIRMHYYYTESILDSQKAMERLGNFEHDQSWLDSDLYHETAMLLLYRHIISNNISIFKDSESEDAWNFTNLLNTEYSDNSSYEIANYGEELKKNTNIPNHDFSISSSSNLSDQYTSKNLTDYKLNTTWAEGTKSSGVGEWIKIDLKAKKYVSELLLFPGYGKSEQLFYKNNRIKKIKVFYGENTDTIEFDDLFYAKKIKINDTVSTIKLTVVDVYKGEKFNDLCISEIMLLK